MDRSLRDVALSALQDLADKLAATASLLIVEGNEAVALAVVEPTTARYHIVFREGSRHPLDRGAASYALIAAGPPIPNEPEKATQARQQGYATSFGEVEPGAYGVAAPIPRPDSLPRACVNLITFRQDIAQRAPADVLATARAIGTLLA